MIINLISQVDIVIVAEVINQVDAYTIADQIAKKHPEYDVRVTVLGHIQRRITFRF